MSVLEVLTHPNPILRQVCQAVENFGPELSKQIEDMFDTMKTNNGVGLAASQVGILQRILVLNYKKRQLILVNPQILSKKKKSEIEEGCLSLPGILVLVPRAKTIVVKAQNEKGEIITLKETGMIATIIQHEIDHLDGILIIDHGPQILQNEDEPSYLKLQSHN